MTPSPVDDSCGQKKYDIFQEDATRQLVWVEVVTGLEETKKRLLSLASTSQNRYHVYDSAKGNFIELSNRKSA